MANWRTEAPMTKCSCGRTIEKVPSWMNGVQVQFVCTNCPNRSNVKSIAYITLETKEPEQEAQLIEEDLPEDEIESD